MTARRPGAPRSAGRPVPASRGRRGERARSATGSRPGSASSRPAAASRPRSSARPDPAEETDGPVITITRRALILIAVIVVALATLVPTVNSYVAQRQQLAELQDKVSQQQEDKKDLQAQVNRWDDPNYVAAQARERLLYAMPGETQYRLMDSSGQDVPLTSAQQEQATKDKGDWFTTLWSSVEGASRADGASTSVPPADGHSGDPEAPGTGKHDGEGGSSSDGGGKPQQHDQVDQNGQDPQ
ncbi:septum formation initiator [Brachybacterium endophyticum]|uniref:Septum formation initiator n=1 Tax=Brachybacterium endophyticum TaxID=2182385 RepID=A0A2U2RMA4_9MICO|nr:septum formation initiator family protein [Brachybacterium endophyticum]PWH06976.1 septum formation initiator [Brachybacterium endophyticum]